MNESETRAELIDPAIAAAGWGTVEGRGVRREFEITKGRIQPGGRRAKRVKADYVLVYRGKNLATIEAKSDEKAVAEAGSQTRDRSIRRTILNTGLR